MHLRRIFPFALLSLALVLLSACSTKPPPGVTPVQSFDIERYAGQWHEIARLDHRFERGLSQVTADYQLNDDGTVKVTNRGYDAKKDQWSEAVGKGRFAGDRHIGSLEVSFFGPFYGGYHVVALDDDSQWAMVIGNNHHFMWILARDSVLDDAVLETLLLQASEIGVDIDNLIWVEQASTQ